MDNATECAVVDALFDFMGWLTTRDEVLEVGASKLTPPAVEALEEYANMRGLNLVVTKDEL